MSVNWKHPFWRYVGIAIAIVAIVVAGWFLIGRIFPDNKPGPTENEKRADFLAATKPQDKALVDSSNARIKTRGIVSGKAEDAARVAQDKANAAKRRADSLAIAKQWDSAYVARTEEADSLRAAGAHKDTVIVALKADTTDLRFQLGIVNTRLSKTEQVNAGLRKDLGQARQCKVLHFINCPSRIQTVAITAATYFAVDRYQRR